VERGIKKSLFYLFIMILFLFLFDYFIAQSSQFCKIILEKDEIKQYRNKKKLRILVISWSVCPWQAFPAKSNICW
jgi:hypothetical protein